MTGAFAMIAALGAACVLMVGAWLVSLRLRDVSIVDPFWPTAAVVIAITVYFLSPHAGARALLALTLTGLWALRLGCHLMRRFLSEPQEDPRYARMRAAVGPSFAWRSLFVVFGLQAVAIWVVTLPVQAAILAENQHMGAPAMIGCALFLAGFVLEAEADRQLAEFKASHPGPDALMTSGLWAWSRHPNYLGEVIIWWGLALVALGTGAWWSPIGPIVLTLLILRVSGVPMMERQLDGRPGIEAYRRRTSRFWPRPPREH